MEKLSFRNQCNFWLSGNTFTVVFISVISVLMFITENIGQILGFIGIIIILWAGKWNWTNFGWHKNFKKETFFKAILGTLLIIFFVDIILTPLVETLLNQPINLENFEGLKGNLSSLIISIVLMWIIAAIGEELLYRGYIMKKIAILLGNSNKTWIIAAFISSVIFGFAHLYQGSTGIITAAAVAIIFSVTFLKNRNNLMVCILMHGFYDTFGLTMIYLDKETILTDFMQQYIFSF